MNQLYRTDFVEITQPPFFEKRILATFQMAMTIRVNIFAYGYIVPLVCK